MARLHHQSVVPISVVLLLAGLAAAATAAAAEEGKIRISVQYPTEEESQWLDRWAAKYRAQGSGSGDMSVQPATEEESAYLNRMFSNGGKKSDGEDGGGAVRAGFDGHIEFDDGHPFGRIVVDSVHSRASSSKPNDDHLQNQESSHAAEAAEHDVKDL